VHEFTFKDRAYLVFFIIGLITNLKFLQFRPVRLIWRYHF